MSSPPPPPPTPPSGSGPTHDATPAAGNPEQGGSRRVPRQTMTFFVPFPPGHPDGPPAPGSTAQGAARPPGERRGMVWTFEIHDGPSDEQLQPPQPTQPGGEATPTHPEGDGPAPNPAAAPDQPRPGPPLFFVVGPDGAVRPTFPGLGPFGPLPTANTGADPGANFNFNLPSSGGPAPFFLPPTLPFVFPFNIPVEPQPDPAEAAELLRSLPTVDKGMLKRINRIFEAEDDEEAMDDDAKGWKCSICLEGQDNLEVENSESGVKALPCNHLFHAACLEPWFMTRHTCPTCRLDLDPLQTLKSPEPQQANVRPAATGSGRTTPHPYRRDRPVRTQTQTEAPEAQPGIPQPPRFTFTFNFPAPPPATSSATASSQNQQEPHLAQPDSTPPLAAPLPIHLNIPLPTENIFGGPTRSSPAPLSPPQPSSPVPLHTASPAANEPETGTTTRSHETEASRARPERRPHITIVHADPPGTPPGHQFNGPSGSVPSFPQPHFHIIPPPPGARPSVTSAAMPSQSAPARTPSPFVPRSLESWASDREKALGLRCDAPECSLAPSPETDGDLPSRPTGEGKDMLSIFAPDQSPFSHKPLAGEFTHLACAHRWHRDCLESEERSAGRWNIGEDGRVWVRCGLCRKDGWVVSGEVAEEELVEGLVAEA